MPAKVPHLGFDGNVYPYQQGHNTARIVRKVREVTGKSVLAAAQELFSGEPDIDVALVLYYAAALQAGKDPNYEALLDEVSEANPITFEIREVDDDPETHGAGS